jgi:hypothetical protein
VDRDQRSVSFLNFLELIRSSPKVLSRERYKRLFVGHDCPQGWPDACFDGLAGKGAQHIDTVVLSKEIAELQGCTAAVKQYVNKRVAHRDAGDFRPVPRFQDIDRAVEFLDFLVVRYLNYLRGISMKTTLPVWQYDWQQIFRYPWIADATETT